MVAVALELLSDLPVAHMVGGQGHSLTFVKRCDLFSTLGRFQTFLRAIVDLCLIGNYMICAQQFLGGVLQQAK